VAGVVRGAFVPAFETGSVGWVWFFGACRFFRLSPFSRISCALAPNGRTCRIDPFLPMLPTLNLHAGGIDAGSRQFFVAVPSGAVTSFESHTADLYRLRDHLQQHEVTTVAMEATGVYWLCLYDVLEEAGIEVYLVNGAHVKNLPGRKSDVQDCQWLQQLHAHGLLRKSFIPAEAIRRLRSYLRLRDDHIRSAAMYVQLMQKALDQLNVKLHTVISQIHGASGLAVIRAILAGERRPAHLAELCDARILKQKRAAVERSLHGRWKEEHLFALRQALAGWEFCEGQVKECDAAIARQLATLNQDQPLPPASNASTKSGRHHVPEVPDLHGHLLALSGGQDASVLSGLTDTSWLKLMGEVGPDLSRWPTEKAFCSWLGLSPGKNQSGKRERRARRRPKTMAGQIFRLAAQSVGKSRYLALGGFYRRLKARTNAAVATVATARKLAVLYYRTMRHGLAYVERGLEAYQAAYRERQKRYLQKSAADLGFALTPMTTSG
jgi:transposase